ncbi:DUF2268 domain-containing protein [Hyphobacterium sp. SN044]|uniref:DUF2268 domain-containing putative Zn-dependent protease n=1 Tax=Hyphobacterium sp. SN044 TaxID=2912575 RepID=UPI001F2BB530|nr:DUF2268 domain-containing putative Zn-dependent protease [Hyphobacterium sp. SN044]MCF8878723.1 DUF2268 domain-containing protein [Hyphobacterium sp. SN044]
MRAALLLAASILIIAPAGATAPAVKAEVEAVTAFGLDVTFAPTEAGSLDEDVRSALSAILDATYADVVALYPDLGAVTVEVQAIDRSAVDAIGGVTGRAQRPGVIVIEVSVTYPDGALAAVEANLARNFYHELHHLARGWTIEDNAFGPGIHIAAINEGLAVVFSEEMTGQADASGAVPDDPEAWALEIRDLPLNANYWEWMFDHPDGREAIGYRTGTWLVRQAMANTGLTLLEMAERSPDEIWQMAGFEPRVE